MEQNIKIAIIHDWLTGMRGGEKVLEALCELYPQADIFTLLHNPGSVSGTIERHKIEVSFINHLPFKKNKYRHYLPLFPTAIERFNLKGYNLILSTSHCVAKGVITPPDAVHISYLHTPMRYVWDMYDEYFGAPAAGWLTRTIIPYFANYLRMWDVTSSNRVDWFLANSAHVAKRIQKYYRREAKVIHPPVDISAFLPGNERGDYFLIVSALVPYKKVDLAVKTFNKLGKKLLIIGSGPEKKKLQRLAGKTIEFMDWLEPKELQHYYSRCKALIFPGEEDFGIVPVEAMACGKPVLAYGKGGALETVVGLQQSSEKNATGIFFHEQTITSLSRAIQQSEETNWNYGFISTHAQQFSKDHFKKKYSTFVEEKFKIS